jgi:hypothetical protein
MIPGRQVRTVRVRRGMIAVGKHAHLQGDRAAERG